MYSNECLLQGSVFEWLERFQDDLKDVNVGRPGRRSTLKTDENIEKIVSKILTFEQ